MAGDTNGRKEPPVTYGFYDRLKAEFPSQVIVDMTEVCNLACIHCPHPAFKQSEHYAARHLDPELNRKLVDEVALVGPEDRIRDRLQAWKEAGKKKHVGSLLAGTGDIGALRVLAEEVL